MTFATDLRPHVSGHVWGPGDDGFEDARRPWNRAVEQPAAVVVRAASVADVATVVRLARQEGLAVAPQASGHGASGDVEGVVLLNTSALDTIEVHPGERWARVGAGVQWGRLLAEVAPHGLIGLAGSSPVVSVVGYTLNGGLSWFSRQHGLAAGGVRALEVVDADGEVATVTAESDPDLFWALRGGGGDFGVVTSLDFDLHPAPSLVGGRIMWPIEKAAAVLDAFREVTADAPESLTVWLSRFQFPGAPPMVAVDATFLGTEAEARALLAPLDRVGGASSDSRKAMSPASLGDVAMEPTDPSPGVGRAALLTTLDEAVAGVLLDEPMEPLIEVQVRQLGGALTRLVDSAAGNVEAPYLLYLLGPVTPEVGADVLRKQQAAMIEALGEGRVAPGKPASLLGATEHAGQAFSPPTLARLRRIKAERDPANVFRSNHPVLAAPDPAA